MESSTSFLIKKALNAFGTVCAMFVPLMSISKQAWVSNTSSRMPFYVAP